HSTRSGSTVATAAKPASSQVRNARRRGLVNTRANVSPFSRSPRRRALRSPRSVSGMSVSPVCCPVRVQAVSPCRARYVTGSVALIRPIPLHSATTTGQCVAPRRVFARDVPSRTGAPRTGRRRPYAECARCSRTIGCRRHGKCDEASTRRNSACTGGEASDQPREKPHTSRGSATAIFRQTAGAHNGAASSASNVLHGRRLMLGDRLLEIEKHPVAAQDRTQRRMLDHRQHPRREADEPQQHALLALSLLGFRQHILSAVYSRSNTPSRSSATTFGLASAINGRIFSPPPSAFAKTTRP